MEILPVTRKERFLKAAMDSEPLTIDAVTRIETYLSKISGADVTIPDPVTKIEMYLASIAGADVVLPDPVTRVEKYLAKLAGMDVLVPEPITRIEQFLSDWVNQPVGVLKTISGAVVFVSDALARAAESVTIEINPVQDLHGYANPWPAGGGKNLLPFEDVLTEGWTNTLNGITATYSKGYMRVTGTNTSTSWTNIVSMNSVFVSDTRTQFEAGDYVMSEHIVTPVNIDGASTTNKDSSITATMGVKVRGFYIAVRANETVDWNIPMMFVKGTTRPTTYSPYSNICPISGWSNVNVYREAQYDAGATPYATINLNGTVYGGSLDVTTGVLTVTDQIFDMASVNWVRDPSRPGVFYCGISSKESGFSPILACSCYKLNNVGVTTDEDLYISGANSYGKGAFVRDTSKSAMTGTEFKNSLSGQTLVYKLATPITIQLTPTEIKMLLGENTVWSENGDITLTYMADGNANDVEALNILLGNRYVNLGEPDEATDREALDILLGGR